MIVNSKIKDISTTMLRIIKNSWFHSLLSYCIYDKLPYTCNISTGCNTKYTISLEEVSKISLNDKKFTTVTTKKMFKIITVENDRVNICKQTLQFVLKDLGSIFGSTYQFDGMKICMGKTLVVLEVFIRDLPK